MDNKYILNKLDTLDERLLETNVHLHGIDKSLAVYNEQLKYHIEGVMQLREQNKLLREYIDCENQKLKEALQPVLDEKIKIKSIRSFIIKIGSIITFILGSAYLILKVFGLRI
jgi:hypothetical protein